MSQQLSSKDFIILGHIYAFSWAITALMFLHPDPVIVTAGCGTVGTLLGFTHWWMIKDDKEPDAATP